MHYRHQYIRTCAKKNYLLVDIIKFIPHPEDFDEFVKTHSRYGSIAKRSLEQYMLFAEGVTYAMRNTPRLQKERLELLKKFYAKVDLMFEITYQSPTNYSWTKPKRFSTPQDVKKWMLDMNLENIHLMLELHKDFGLKGSSLTAPLEEIFYETVKFVETAQLNKY